MDIKQQLVLKSSVLKDRVNKYAWLGLTIAVSSIVIATLIVSYQLTGSITIAGLIEAQLSNPALWALDLSPFMFAYWGQSFCYDVASTAETIIDDTTREYVLKSDNLESKLKHESIHDRLTNLPNDLLLTKRVEEGIQQIKTGEELVLMIITINRFRNINHNIGSFSANSLLVQFAEKLKSLLLKPYMLQAYMGMSMVARLQGAEFAILIPRFREEHNLESIVQNLLAEMSVNFMVDGNNIEVKTTAGISLSPPHADTAEELIHQARLALYHAEKKQDSYVFYESSMAKEYKSRRIVLNEIKSAIEQEEFSILYKPVVHLESNKIVGSEAVIHFNNEKYGTMIPEKLMSIAEGTNLVEGLTFFTLKNVVSQLEKWHKSNKELFVRVYLYEAIDPALPDILHKLLIEKNVPAECLRIELTEQACLSDQKHTLQVLNKLDELGIKIAISDFGSGYSSFVYLTNFPIKEIKIDKSFTDTMLTDEKKHRIVEAMIKLAGAMDLNVFADGVSSEAIKEELKKLGCVYGQGDYFSEYIEPDLFYNLYKKSR